MMMRLPTLGSILGLDALGARLIARFDEIGASYARDARSALRQLTDSPPPAPFVSVLIEGEALFETDGPPTRGERMPPSEAWGPGAGDWPRPRREQLRTMGEVRPITFGMSETIVRDGQVLQTQSQRLCRDLRVIVFADLSRVQVQIFYGADMMAAQIGDCPTAYIHKAEPGVLIRVLCNLKKHYVPPELRGPFHEPPSHS